MAVVTKTTARALTYGGIVIGLSVVCLLLWGADWRSPREVHIFFEIAAALLAVVVGVLALLEFHASRSKSYLFIGIGFLGAAFLDGLHATVSASFFGDLSHATLVPWIWHASCTFLALLMFLSWWEWKREQELSPGSRVTKTRTHAGLILAIVCIGCAFALLPLPRAYSGNLYFSRPQEAVAAGLFLTALIGYLKKGRWRIDLFEHCIVVALILAFMSQALFISHSSGRFHAMSDLANMLKITSYAAVLTGLLLEVHALFVVAHQGREALEKANEALLGTLFERKRIQDELNKRDAALSELNETLQDQVRERTAELESARDAAEAASRAKSRFLATMSHEIKTPLNGIHGFTSLLQQAGNEIDEAERQGCLDTIHTSCEHLVHLINDILELSRIETGDMEIRRIPCAPHEIVAGAASRLRGQAREKGLSLEVEYTSPVPAMIQTDPEHLRELIDKLLTNALKFTEEGAVCVRVCLAADREAPALRIEVIDTGVGIPPEAIDRIFDPFVQADNSSTRAYGGTGLGLPICKYIAESLGGAISIRSEVDRGTTVTVEIETGPLGGVKMVSGPPSVCDRTDKLPKKTAVSGTIDSPAPAAPQSTHGVGPSGTAVVSSLPADDADFREIIEDFVKSLHARMDLMRAAWRKRDFAGLAGLAAWLKDAGGMAGFVEFAEPADLLERSSHAASEDEIQGALNDLEDLAGRVVVEA